MVHHVLFCHENHLIDDLPEINKPFNILELCVIEIEDLLLKRQILKQESGPLCDLHCFRLLSEGRELD